MNGILNRHVVGWRKIALNQFRAKTFPSICKPPCYLGYTDVRNYNEKPRAFTQIPEISPMIAWILAPELQHNQHNRSSTTYIPSII